VSVIPDSIEPYVGYKWLTLREGRLWSQHNQAPWPEKEPLLARCTSFGHGWHWVARPWEECVPQAAFNPTWGAGPFGGVTAQTAIANFHSAATFTNTGFQNKYVQPKPTTSLPYGQDWSFEPYGQCETSPQEHCSCGIYVASTPEECLGYFPGVDGVLVEVAVWGETIIGQYGARGQYAYPQRVLSVKDWESAALITDTYGIPVELDAVLAHERAIPLPPPRIPADGPPVFPLILAIIAIILGITSAVNLIFFG